ncbi:hypothetical protein V8E53_015334 [Lactarius tabidus]
MLAVYSSARVQLHIFGFEDERGSLRGMGSAVDLLPFSNNGEFIVHAYFVRGCEKILFVDSTRARIFSLTMLQPKEGRRVHGDPVTAYHWTTFASTDGIAITLPDFPVDLEAALLTSITSRKPTGDVLKIITVSARTFTSFSGQSPVSELVNGWRTYSVLFPSTLRSRMRTDLSAQGWRFVGTAGNLVTRCRSEQNCRQLVNWVSYWASKLVKVVSSIDEQSVGKSFTLNHLVDTSFAGSAMRTTEGVWLSVSPTNDALIVALDFEGVHSLERSAQEDTLLVLFNSAISNLSFQSSASILDPASSPSLFRSTLLVIIKDVIDSDKAEVMKEFSLKFQKIVEDEQDTNFITRQTVRVCQTLCRERDGRYTTMTTIVVTSPFNAPLSSPSLLHTPVPVQKNKVLGAQFFCRVVHAEPIIKIRRLGPLSDRGRKQSLTIRRGAPPDFVTDLTSNDVMASPSASFIPHLPKIGMVIRTVIDSKECNLTFHTDVITVKQACWSFVTPGGRKEWAKEWALNGGVNGQNCKGAIPLTVLPKLLSIPPSSRLHDRMNTRSRCGHTSPHHRLSFDLTLGSDAHCPLILSAYAPPSGFNDPNSSSVDFVNPSESLTVRVPTPLEFTLHVRALRPGFVLIFGVAVQACYARGNGILARAPNLQPSNSQLGVVHIEEFKKELTQEVSISTQEVDRLQWERLLLEQQSPICLCSIRSRNKVHEQGLLDTLQCEPTKEAVAAVLAEWPAEVLEAEVFRRRLCAAALCSYNEMDETIHGIFQTNVNPIFIAKIDDAPKWVLTRYPTCARGNPSVRSDPRTCGTRIRTHSRRHREAHSLISGADLFLKISTIVPSSGLSARGFSPEACAALRPGIFDSLVQMLGGFDVQEAESATLPPNFALFKGSKGRCRSAIPVVATTP